jgi:hypothetical protein
LPLSQRQLAALISEAARAAQYRAASTDYSRYALDPLGFVRDCFRWQGSDGPAPYQAEILTALVEHRRACVRSPHGAGKTCLAAWLVLWFALTRDGNDWKVVTTASAWRQLTHYLWPEIRKWARALNWSAIGRAPFTRDELLMMNLKLSTGEAFAVASDNADLVEGAHASHILYVFDEAKAIPAPMWDAAEGALSSGDAYALAISTPAEPAGRFYDIQARKAGYTDWWTKHVTLEDAVKAGRISMDWAEQRARQWGAQSAVYLNRVKGEFASGEADGIMPLAWIDAANARWLAWDDAGRSGQVKTIGVDVARSGEDKTCIAILKGNAVDELRYYSHDDTMVTAGRVEALCRTAQRANVVVDVIGVGAGVVDKLRSDGIAALAFNASERTDMLDSSGELGFVNCRAASWWMMREVLDPVNCVNVALPPDDVLTGDLCAPRYKVVAGGKIQVESKDDIKKRIGRSTDAADAVIMALVGDVLITSGQVTRQVIYNPVRI